MGARFDWDTMRREFEGGASAAELAKRHGAAQSTIQARAAREDWGGLQTRQRQARLVDMLLKAAEKVVQAESAAEAERRAKALSAVATVAKAVREFDPKLAAACEAAPEEEDPETLAAMRREFDAEMERLIEERVEERVAARTPAAGE